MSNIAIKKIDKLLLRTFITTFILLLALVLFVMVIQTFFSLFHSLAGKGLGTGTYARLLFYLCLNIFPNAFPIAVLMASLIVFGNFSESFELTAMRSIGLSLERTLRFPFFFVLFLSGALFYFQHYIHPNSKHKIFSLVMDVLEKKSALFIREGIFCNNIPGYSIRVDKKPAGSDSVKGIIIYDYTQRYGVVSITVAEEGRLYTTSDEGYLVMELINGHNYIEPLPAKNSDTNLEQTPFYRSTFSTQKIKISLGALQLGQTTDHYAHDPRTRTRPHLKKMIQARTEEAMEQCQSNKTFLTEQAMPYHAAEQQGRELSTPKIESLPSPRQATNQDMDFIAFRDRIIGRKKASDVAEPYDYRLQRVVEKALRSVKKVTATLIREQDIRAERKRNLNDALYQQAHRCSAAVQCVIMFLLAAPLGCIIRRGGFGISVVISSFFILLDYILSIFGKECAIVGTLSTFIGAWLPNLVLLPFCCFFLLKAEQGRGLFSTDWYALYIKIKRSAKQKISRAPKGQI